MYVYKIYIYIYARSLSVTFAACKSLAFAAFTCRINIIMIPYHFFFETIIHVWQTIG